MQNQVSQLAARARASYMAENSTFLSLREPKVLEPDLVKLGKAWHEARHAPTDPVVAVYYRRLLDDVDLQMNHLVSAGLTFEFHDDPQIYATQPALVEDLDDNSHLYVWSGRDLPEDHPLSAPFPSTALEDAMYVHALRAVHDVFGHALGHGFATLSGERAAFHSHLGMFTPGTWPALLSELMAPLAWLQFGPHVQAAEAATPWRDRPYPRQKAVILSPEFWPGGTGDPDPQITVTT